MAKGTGRLERAAEEVPVEIPRLAVCDHPVIQEKLFHLRDRRTEPVAFKQHADQISSLLTYEATRDLPVREDTVRTPLEEAPVRRIDVGEILVVAILRAGLGMLEGARRVLPQARFGMLGYERDEETLEARFYYAKVPPPRDDQAVLVVDPMLATGGTAVAAIDFLEEEGYSNITFIGIVGAPEGTARLHEAHPDVAIHLAAMDRALDENGFILPGLGDAGDRIFGTRDTGQGTEV